MDKKVLIVYYTQSAGNTGRIAWQLQKAIGGDTVSLEPITPYKGSHSAMLKQTAKEIKAGYRPELTEPLPYITDYDVVAVGSPVWWFHAAPPLQTFLTNGQSWVEKPVIPFVTHGGFPGKALQNLKKLCPRANFGPEIAVQFDSKLGSTMKTSEEEVQRWLQACKDWLA